MKTSIEWAEHSVNPIRARHKNTGKVGHYCEKIASGCARCYSSDMQKRFGTPEFGSGQHRDEFDIFLDESKLEEVRRRKKPTRYFWCSMTDFFGDWMESEWLAKCFATMDATPQHHHMLLTKRPGNIRRMWPLTPGIPNTLVERDHDGKPCGFKKWDRTTQLMLRPNVHLYYSASDQTSLEAGINDLLACRDLTPTLGLSIEPMVCGIDPTYVKRPKLQYEWRDILNGQHVGHSFQRNCASIDHVIVGCESGPKRRPMRQVWVDFLLKQCQAAGVAYFLKQMEVDGQVTGDIEKFPKHLQVRQFPKSFERVNA